MIIAATLLILVVLSIFSVILGASFFGVIIDTSISNSAIINGSATTFMGGAGDLVFNIDPIAGMVASLAGWVAIALAFGIRAFGSGLSDEASRIATLTTIYAAIWTILSALAIPLIFAIEIFGAFIYVTLTIAYTVGVIQKIGGRAS